MTMDNPEFVKCLKKCLNMKNYCFIESFSKNAKMENPEFDKAFREHCNLDEDIFVEIL